MAAAEGSVQVREALSPARRAPGSHGPPCGSQAHCAVSGCGEASVVFPEKDTSESTR